MPEIRGSYPAESTRGYEVEHVPEWFHPGTPYLPGDPSTYQGHEEFENRCSTDEIRLRAELAAMTARLALAEVVCKAADEWESSRPSIALTSRLLDALADWREATLLNPAQNAG